MRTFSEPMRVSSYKKRAETGSDNDTNMSKYDEIEIIEEIDTRSKMREDMQLAEGLLERQHLDEAENLLYSLYMQIQEKPEDSSITLIQILQSMADISKHRSRVHRHNPMESIWMTIHGIAILQEVQDLCETELANLYDNQNSAWYTRNKFRAQRQVTQLQETLIKSFYNQLRKQGYCKKLLQALTPVNPSTPDSRSYFPLSSNMPHQQSLPYHRSSTFDTLNMLRGKELSPKAELSETTDFIMKFQVYWKSRLYNRDIEEVMNALPSESSTPVMTTKQIKTRRSSVPFPSSDDIAGFDRGKFVSSTPRKQQRTQEHDKMSVQSTDDEVFYSDSGSDLARESNESITDRNNPNDTDGEHSHISVIRDSLQPQGVDLDSFLQSTQQFSKREPVTPVDNKVVCLIIAKALNIVADKLNEDGELRKAEALFDHILEIMEEIQNGTIAMLRLNAQIFSKAGVLKSRLGRFETGVRLVEGALTIFKDLRESTANIDIARSMLELGNSHMAKKWQDNAILDVVINVVCDSFEKDVADVEADAQAQARVVEQDSGDSGVSELETDSDILQAKKCYLEALIILEDEHMNNEIFARATLKLGDCHFLAKDFNMAIDKYEQSLTLFKALPSSKSFTLQEHSHLLCMLGVASLKVYLYPRAASAFEIACHLTRTSVGKLEIGTFSTGLSLSLLAIAHYKLQNHYKSVSFCFQAWEIFWKLYGESIPHLGKEKFWLICQVLYIMGNSYKVLNMHQKALKYLTIGRSILNETATEKVDRKQFMRVLQVLGDCYFAQYDYKTALTFYNEALEFSDEYGMNHTRTDQTASDMGLHNQLLSRSADANISMNQYQNAMGYLSEARNIQDEMEGDIKGDLVSTLKRIAVMHSVSGDVDKAIEAFKESLDIYREMHGELGPDMCDTLGNLATMCHVKACICEDIDQELEMNLSAEKFFQEALALDMKGGVCVKYANFLFSQSNYDDAIFYLEDVLKLKNLDKYITFSGLEKVTLPGSLQDEVEFEEEIVIPCESLARYLLILSFCTVGLAVCAEEELIKLMADVYSINTGLLHSLLGYAMMELHLFQEAAHCFSMSEELNPENPLTEKNYWMCVILHHFFTVQKALENMWIAFGWFNEEYV